MAERAAASWSAGHSSSPKKRSSRRCSPRLEARLRGACPSRKPPRRRRRCPSWTPSAPRPGASPPGSRSRRGRRASRRSRGARGWRAPRARSGARRRKRSRARRRRWRRRQRAARNRRLRSETRAGWRARAARRRRAPSTPTSPRRIGHVASAGEHAKNQRLKRHSETSVIQRHSRNRRRLHENARSFRRPPHRCVGSAWDARPAWRRTSRSASARLGQLPVRRAPEGALREAGVGPEEVNGGPSGSQSSRNATPPLETGRDERRFSPRPPLAAPIVTARARRCRRTRRAAARSADARTSRKARIHRNTRHSSPSALWSFTAAWVACTTRCAARALPGGGARVVGAFDINPNACDVYEKNFGTRPIQELRSALFQRRNSTPSKPRCGSCPPRASRSRAKARSATRRTPRAGSGPLAPTRAAFARQTDARELVEERGGFETSETRRRFVTNAGTKRVRFAGVHTESADVRRAVQPPALLLRRQDQGAALGGCGDNRKKR